MSEFESHHLEFDGRFLYAESGGDGLPLLFCHGMWCHSGQLRPIMRTLTGEFQTIAFDFRGHGRSCDSNRPWTIETAGRDIVRVMDALGIERAAIAGYSMGGMAALHTALSAPDRVASLILISTSAAAEHFQRRLEIKTLLMTLGFTGPTSFIVRQAARALYTRRFQKARPEAVSEWCEHVLSMSRPALVNALEAVGTRPSVMDRLPGIACPALILIGEQDIIATPGHSRQMAALLPAARLTPVPQVGHALPFEKPRLVADQTRLFLTSHRMAA